MNTPADQPPDHPLVPPSNPGGASTTSVPPLHTRPAPPSPPAFPSAAPQPAVSGYGAPAWSQQPPAWGAPQQVGAASAEPALTKAGTALWWAIGAAVGALVALGFAVVALFVAVGTGPSTDPFDDSMYMPLRDHVEGFKDGQALSGPILVGQIRELLAEQDVSLRDIAISCPDTASVKASTVVVCSGDVEGFQWTGVVLFENSEGAFVVLET